jgi:hypothetical protein
MRLLIDANCRHGSLVDFTTPAWTRLMSLTSICSQPSRATSTAGRSHPSARHDRRFATSPSADPGALLVQPERPVSSTRNWPAPDTGPPSAYCDHRTDWRRVVLSQVMAWRPRAMSWSTASEGESPESAWNSPAHRLSAVSRIS